GRRTAVELVDLVLQTWRGLSLVMQPVERGLLLQCGRLAVLSLGGELLGLRVVVRVVERVVADLLEHRRKRRRGARRADGRLRGRGLGGCVEGRPLRALAG